MAEHHDLVVRGVVHQLEVVSGLPVVALFPDQHAVVLAVINLDDTVSLFVVEFTISAQDAGENFDLIVVFSLVHTKGDFVDAIAVDAV